MYQLHSKWPYIFKKFECAPNSSAFHRQRSSYHRLQSLSRISNQAVSDSKASMIASRRPKGALRARDDRRGPAAYLITRLIIATDNANLDRSDINSSSSNRRWSNVVSVENVSMIGSESTVVWSEILTRCLSITMLLKLSSRRRVHDGDDDDDEDADTDLWQSFAGT